MKNSYTIGQEIKLDSGETIKISLGTNSSKGYSLSTGRTLFVSMRSGNTINIPLSQCMTIDGCNRLIDRIRKGLEDIPSLIKKSKSAMDR